MTAVLLWAMVGDGRADPPDDRVLRALSSRDPLSCEEIAAMTPAPLEAFTHVVDTVQAPPWAPMRAAQCLIEGHAVQVQPRLERWVVDPALRGLGRLVLGQLDALPVEVAVPVARKALIGPDPELAAAKIRLSASPEVRAVVAP